MEANPTKDKLWSMHGQAASRGVNRGTRSSFDCEKTAELSIKFQPEKSGIEQWTRK